MTVVHALLETIPPASAQRHWEPGSQDFDHRYETVTVRAGSYEQARKQVMEQVPDGWRVVNLRVER